MEHLHLLLKIDLILYEESIDIIFRFIFVITLSLACHAVMQHNYGMNYVIPCMH